MYLATPLLKEEGKGEFFIKSGAPVVIKAVRIPSRICRANDPFAEIAAFQLLDEAYQRRQQRCHHIVPLLDSFQDNHHVYMVFPHLSGGDLFARVKSMGVRGLPEPEAANYVRQMCEALLFMKESAGLAHNDISLENICATDKNRHHVQLIDLGMSVYVPEPIDSAALEASTAKAAAAPSAPPSSEAATANPVPTLFAPQKGCGKVTYLAPEIILEEPYEPYSADVWSLGICLYVSRP